MAMVRRSNELLVCDPDRMNIQRMAAAGVVLLGGVFWAVAAFSGDYVFHNIALTQAVGSALIPLAITVVVFALGWYSELSAAIVLFSMSAAGLVWGAIVSWDPILWALMVTFFIAPMVVAGGLYVAAWRMDGVCRVERGIGLRPATDPSSTR